MTPDNAMERLRKMIDPNEVGRFMESAADILTEERFFAFVGNDHERYHGIMVAIFKNENKYAILIYNAFKPDGRKGEYIYFETVEEAISFIKKDADIHGMIMGILSKGYYLQTPRKENMEIDLVEMVSYAFRIAGTKLVRIILPVGFDETSIMATEALIPYAEVILVG